MCCRIVAAADRLSTPASRISRATRSTCTRITAYIALAPSHVSRVSAISARTRRADARWSRAFLTDPAERPDRNCASAQAATARSKSSLNVGGSALTSDNPPYSPRVDSAVKVIEDRRVTIRTSGEICAIPVQTRRNCGRLLPPMNENVVLVTRLLLPFRLSVAGEGMRGCGVCGDAERLREAPVQQGA